MHTRLVLVGLCECVLSAYAEQLIPSDVKKGGGWQADYGYLYTQQGMLMDHVRMELYRNVTQAHAATLSKATVMDVGAGSGILAYFAATVGASKVYAVEASNMAPLARRLMQANGYGDTVEVLHSALEDVKLPSKVDALISEPIGILLLHERMLETYLDARDRFLRPGGLMLPSAGEIFVAPLANEALRNQQIASVSFWDQSDFYGLNLTELHVDATDEAFKKIFLGQIPPDSIISRDRARIYFDFHTIQKQVMQKFSIPLNFSVSRSGQMDGIVCWFEVAFNESVVLYTSPDDPLTHWWHVQILFREPLQVEQGQLVVGKADFLATERMSYKITVEAEVQASYIDSKPIATAQASVDTTASIQLPYLNVHDFEGWTRHWSKEHHNYFYYNPTTHVSSWDPSQAEQTSPGERKEL